MVTAQCHRLKELQIDPSIAGEIVSSVAINGQLWDYFLGERGYPSRRCMPTEAKLF